MSMQVVDNSSAFRMTEGVPLIIPEVNPHAVGDLKAGKGGIIANPNCSTIIALMAVTPLHKTVPVKRMVISTYQVCFRQLDLYCHRVHMRKRRASLHTGLYKSSRSNSSNPSVLFLCDPM